jgi:hypothetical protein
MKIFRKKLSNGITLIFSPTAKISDVIITVGFEAGRSIEPIEKSEIAHLTEHLFFVTVRKKIIGEIIEENAITTEYNTLYYVHCDMDNIAYNLNILIQTLLEPDFRQIDKLLENEKKVVSEELNMREQNINFGRMSYEILDDMFGRFNNTSNTTLKNITAADIKKYIQNIYIPENCTILVHGNFSIDYQKNKIYKVANIKLPPSPDNTEYIKCRSIKNETYLENYKKFDKNYPKLYISHINLPHRIMGEIHYIFRLGILDYQFNLDYSNSITSINNYINGAIFDDLRIKHGTGYHKIVGLIRYDNYYFYDITCSFNTEMSHFYLKGIPAILTKIKKDGVPNKYSKQFKHVYQQNNNHDIIQSLLTAMHSQYSYSDITDYKPASVSRTKKLANIIFNIDRLGIYTVGNFPKPSIKNIKF